MRPPSSSQEPDFLRNKINERLSILIPEQKDLPYNKLFLAARYSLLEGGKRLRPILAILTAETFGVSYEIALDSACAIEMIQTYSLIHDDLPCMDDDDFRRGKPSLHKVFGDAHAVLTGDYLLTYAFDVIANDHKLSAEQRLAIIAVLAKGSGGDGMIAGQVMDIEAENGPVDIERLTMIHRYKTGALITASIEIGGIIANATPNQFKILRQFGQDIGLAFQIVDDILDVTNSVQKHGKEISSDMINDKTTFLDLLGMDGSSQKAKALVDNGCAALLQLGVDTTMLASLAHQIVRTHK